MKPSLCVHPPPSSLNRVRFIIFSWSDKVYVLQYVVTMIDSFLWRVSYSTVNAHTGMVSTQVANHRKVKESNTETKEDIWP